MSYYRYAVAFHKEDTNEKNIRSLTPFPIAELERHSYFTYRYYTSEKDDSPNCHVISLGRDLSYPGKIHGPRTVNRFILHYVIRGRGLFNGKQVSGGQFFFTHPYEEFKIESSVDEPLEFYYIGIAGPGTESIMKNAGFFSLSSITACPFIERIPSLFYEPLFETPSDSDPDLYLMSFFLRLMSIHKTHHIQQATPPTEDAFFYYKQALIFIEEYLLGGITPNDVAQYLHISPSYLRMIFSKYCKYSLREFLIRKKLECAANHLVFHRYSVSAAASLIGYDDYTLFSRIFKKYTGLSPQAYKNAHRAPEATGKSLKVFPDETE